MFPSKLQENRRRDCQVEVLYKNQRRDHGKYPLDVPHK
jgi:hypothetical protein